MNESREEFRNMSGEPLEPNPRPNLPASMSPPAGEESRSALAGNAATGGNAAGGNAATGGARPENERRGAGEPNRQQPLGSISPPSPAPLVGGATAADNANLQPSATRASTPLPTISGPGGPPAPPRGTAAAPQRSSGLFWSNFFWGVCCAAFVVGFWQLGPLIAERYQYAVTRGRAQAEYDVAKQALLDPTLAGVSQSYQMVAQKIKPSVVSIECDKERGQGQGSGIIIDAAGYIVTNDHVVEGSNDIRVTLFDRHSYPAKLIGRDPVTDLAVIKISAPKLIPAEWGDSQRLEVGSIVWAVGSPYGFSQTVTSGIISGKNRLMIDVDQLSSFNRMSIDRSRFQELLQTDAAINPGNSGGPLVDSLGKVVGINTSILGDFYQGISFAVPSSVAEFVVGQLIRNGVVQRGFLGFTPERVTQPMMEALSLQDLNGAFVRNVMPNSPADLAGLRERDVIRSWNGESIDDFNRVYNLIGITPPNQTVIIDVVRQGQPIQLTVTVTERPADINR